MGKHNVSVALAGHSVRHWWYGQGDKPRSVLPPLSRDTLAEMIGTTRSGVFMTNDTTGREQPWLDAERAREKTEGERQLGEQGRRVSEERRLEDESARGDAEQLRRLAEASRVRQEEHRGLLEQVRQEREAFRDAAEEARRAAEEARLAAEDARHATIDAVRVTAEALSANLEQMKFVEQMRRIYRDLKDLKDPDSN